MYIHFCPDPGSKPEFGSVRDRNGIYSQISIYSKKSPVSNIGKSQTTPPILIVKFQQLNSELSHMKHFQEVFKSDLQAVKIRPGHFLEMFPLKVFFVVAYNSSTLVSSE